MINYFYIKEVTETVRKRHGQEAEHVQTVLVNQITDENIVWNVVVEVFGLRWNQKARRCYAWGQPNAKGGWDITTVLETRPVISAHTAVKSVISALAAVKAALEAKAKPFAA